MAARKAGGEGGGGNGPSDGPVNPRGSLPETRRQPDDSWQAAGRECLTTTFRRLEILASASVDVGELLKIAKEVGDAVGVAEEMAGGK